MSSIDIDSLCNQLTEIVKISPPNPQNILVDLIHKQREKEKKNDIWIHSVFKDLVKLQSNNIGIVGEEYIQHICQLCGLKASLDGTKTKEKGGGTGDGLIEEKSVEIKTAHQGSTSPSFQHELGEKPWKAQYMIFIDISPMAIYLTIFPNFTEEFYKSKQKCEPFFPSKIVTWRKNSGAFKLDTSIKVNEENCEKKYCLKISSNTSIDTIREFFLSRLSIEKESEKESEKE